MERQSYNASFIKYLPEIYQPADREESFFPRFVALFQDMYLEVEKTIEEIGKELDADTSERIGMLSEWLVLREFRELDIERQRDFIRRSPGFYRKWGTTKCLKEVVEWICGEEPVVREHYSEDPFAFMVMLGKAKNDYDPKTIGFIEKAIGSMKPAYTTCRIVYLDQNCTLDTHTYLGVNSTLDGYKRPILGSKQPLVTLQLGE